MKKWGTRCLRPTSMLAMAALILILPACGSSGGGGGGGGPGAPTGSFATNDAAAAPDLVRFGPASCTGDTCIVDILIGATTEGDYYAFAFDLVISDPTVARFLVGTETAGDFLTGTADAIAAQVNDRVVVGVSKSGVDPGNGAGTETSVVKMMFQLLKVGDATLTFSGSPANPSLMNCSPTGPEAINAAGNCTLATTFGAGGTLSGS
ncbi:MAG: hypothetical protein O7D35_03630 [Acidobacteria bacterium]|nr:hypothetical protein [Acidobacteriota bacterium]